MRAGQCFSGAFPEIGADVDEPEILAFSGTACAAVGHGLLGEGPGAPNGTGNVTIPVTPSNVTAFTGDATRGSIEGLVVVTMIVMLGLMFGIL